MSSDGLHSQDKKVKFLFEECEFASLYLIQRDFSGLLDQTLQESQPIPDEFWRRLDYVEDFQRIKGEMPIRALEIIESSSPVLLNRDLASIALLRQGCSTTERVDRISGMISFDEEFPEKYLEAAFSICHWRNWKETPSRWLHWDTFFDLIDLALKIDNYKTWGAYAFIWALVQNGGQVAPEDGEYSELIWHFQDVLRAGLISSDEDLQVACSIALGKIRDWRLSATMSDVLTTL